MYEDYLDSDLLNVILFSKESGIQNDGYLWYVSIQEFEMLLSLYSKSHSRFVEIVNLKIQKEIANDNEGKSLLNLISKYSKEGHSSILNETIDQMTNYNSLFTNN